MVVTRHTTQEVPRSSSTGGERGASPQSRVPHAPPFKTANGRGRTWSKQEVELLLQVANDAAGDRGATWHSMAPAYERVAEERGMESRTHDAVRNKLMALRIELPGTAPVPQRLQAPQKCERKRVGTGRGAATTSPHVTAQGTTETMSDRKFDEAKSPGAGTTARAVNAADTVTGNETLRRLDERLIGEIAAAAAAASVAAVFSYTRPRNPPP